MSRNIPDGRPSGINNGTILQQEDKTAGGIRVYHRCGGCGKKQEFVNSG